MERALVRHHDLAVVIVSHGDTAWLPPCLSSVYAHAGALRLDVVVVSNLAGDGTPELLADRFPDVRVITCENGGFAHGNNRGAMTCSARYVLFLNPDTEIVAGTLPALVAALDERPEVGLAGVRQVSADGDLHPTIRRFPNALRALGDALGAEHWPVRASWLGERELDPAVYDRESDCDWTAGSFMLARREALLGAGLMDERFFLYSEEPDLCYRIVAAGWAVRHLPLMTIIHHAGKGGMRPRMAAQDVFARRQYAAKHFARPHRLLYLAAIALRWGLRRAPLGSPSRRAVAQEALRTLTGRSGAPFRTPPGASVSAPEPLVDDLVGV